MMSLVFIAGATGFMGRRLSAELIRRGHTARATVLRPWYVLGPGRRWPVLLMPMYWLFGALPPTREAAHRLGLVTITQMIEALAAAVDQPARGVRIVEVPEIRAGLSIRP